MLFRAFRWMFSMVLGTRVARWIWGIPGAHRFYQWLMPRIRPNLVVVDGHTIHLDPMDSLLLSVNGTYEPFEQSLFTDCLRPGDTVVDIGAHIGLYTLQAARAVGPTGRVLAFEPSADNYQLLERNVQANGYTNVTTRRLAVADRSGHLQLALSAANTGDHSLLSAATAGRDTETVQVSTLDDEVDGGPVDVVKMDVQGAEPAVLAGAQRTLAAGDVVLFTELSPGHLTDWGGTAAYVASLVDAGFDLFEIVEADEQVIRRAPSHFAGLTAASTADFVNLVCVKGDAAHQRLAAATRA